MTNEELWLLFPVILSPYDPEWDGWYREEENQLMKIIEKQSIVRINHIGSTAVYGMTAKPTIDILLEISTDTDTEELVRKLEENGYIFTEQPDNPPPHMMLLKGYTEKGFAEKVYHLHIRYPGDWNELYFRDYLRRHKSVAHEYIQLKKKLIDSFRNDRDGTRRPNQSS
jgi:GrpB-like predicted nucleotidyltransferase (UPF0157 family)